MSIASSGLVINYIDSFESVPLGVQVCFAQSIFVCTYMYIVVPTVLCIVLVAGLWLAVAETLPTNSGSGGTTCYSNVEVHFGYAYYILLVGGLFSLGAASFNLLFARSAADRRRSVRLRYR